MREKKRCMYCGKRFVPDPRVGVRQKACFDPQCQQQRHDESHGQWRQENPDYFQGSEHYTQQKQWLAKPKNRGYLKRYRKSHPDYVAADNKARKKRRKRQMSDMKDEILRREINQIRALHGADMKDTIQLKIDGILTFLEKPSPQSLSDMKDSMALSTVSVARSSP